MLGQRLAGLRAGAGDDVEHAGRKPDLLGDAPSSSAVSGVSSEGFSTMVQPAASAGATFQAAISSG